MMHNIEASAARNRKHAATLAIGDRVAYTRLFLYSAGIRDRAQWRGVISTRHGKSDLVEVTWEHGGTSTVNTFNLCKPRSISFVE